MHENKPRILIGIHDRGLARGYAFNASRYYETVVTHSLDGMLKELEASHFDRS